MNAHAHLTVNDLSPDQHEAYSGIMTWLNRSTQTKQALSLGGFAGSGKSTVVSVLAHELLTLGPIAFAAFTGKASSVLGRKLRASGIYTAPRISRNKLAMRARPYCGTIHGLIYAPCDVCMIEKEYSHTMGLKCRADGATGGPPPPSEDDLDGSEDLSEDVDASVIGVSPATQDPTTCFACDPPPVVKKDGPCGKCRGERFFRRSALDSAYKLLIIDEASMVDDSMLRDLVSYNVPILAVGDHGQLPPVRGVGSLMKFPDLRLEKIHRQAEGNPIIALSKYIRENGDTSEEFADGKQVEFMSKRHLDTWVGKRFSPARLGVDPTTSEGILGSVMISWTNKQRVALNDTIRQALGVGGEPPQQGEVVICLKNAAPTYNGMRGVLEYKAVSAGSKDYPQWKSDVNFVDDGVLAKNVCMADPQFFNEKTIDFDACREMGKSYGKLGSLYDFGYALTCHKMQGSQANEVAVMTDGLRGMDRNTRTAWLYTAVTRSAEKLMVIC